MAVPNEPVLTETRRPFHRYLALVLMPFFIIGSLSAAQQETGAPAQGLPILKTIRELRELPSEKARLAYPIHLRAVVTYAHKAEGDFFVQDSTAGIFVERRANNQ